MMDWFSVRAEVIMPDDSHRKLDLNEDNGQYVGNLLSTITGIYQFRIRAHGRSRLG